MNILRLLPPALRTSLLTQPDVHLHVRHLATQPQPKRHAESRPAPPPPRESPSPNPLILTSTTLNSYTTTAPPQGPQLKYARDFFTAQPPRRLFASSVFLRLPRSPHPEVAILGRSNVGKSSLLNALFNRVHPPVAYISKKPGRTVEIAGYGVLPANVHVDMESKKRKGEESWMRFPMGGVTVVDMPGYGMGSRLEWGKEALKYIERRKQLRRTFVLVDSEHGLKDSDVQLLTYMRRQGVAFQIVLSKVDKLLFPYANPPSAQKLTRGLLELRDLCGKIKQRLDDEAGDGRKGMSDILCCSAEKGIHDGQQQHRKMGVDELRWAILSVCGLECDQYGNRRTTNRDDIRLVEERQSQPEGHLAQQSTPIQPPSANAEESRYTPLRVSP